MPHRLIDARGTRHGLQGIRHGKVVRTAVSDGKAVPTGPGQLEFRAEQLGVFTYQSTWQGWLYVALVIDIFARRSVGWPVSNGMRTDFVLVALEQALSRASLSAPVA
ncbi:hypothetical protein RFUL19S_01897 [Rhizobacter fulvus]